MIHVSQHWIDTNAQPFVGITSMEGTIFDLHRPSVGHYYSKQYFKSVEIVQHGDILSGAITTIESTIIIDNSIGNNVVSADDIQKLNSEQFHLSYGFDSSGRIEDYRHFISDTIINDDAGTVTFQCKCVLGFMTAEYSGITTGTAAQIAEAAFQQAENDNSVPRNSTFGFQYEYDDSLSNIDIILGSGYTIIEVLQLIANACRCVIFVDRFSKIYIKPRNAAICNYAIPRLLQYKKATVTVDPPIHGAKVTYHGGSAADYSSTVLYGGLQTADNPALVATSGTEGSALAAHILSELSDHPQTVTGTFRADPRAELFDVVQVEYNNSVRAVVLTDLKYTYNGAWLGEFTGRDMGEGIISDDESIDVYNTMTEYLASVENGRGSYQPYTSDYDTFEAYIEGGE